MDLKNKHIPHDEKLSQLFEHKRDVILLEPVTYIIQTTPTNIWSELAAAFNHWLNVPPKLFEQIDNSYCKLYYSHILFECLRDHSVSQKTDSLSWYSKFGIPRIVNAMFQIHFYGTRSLIRINPLKTPNLYIESMENICIAWCMVQQWNESLICPTEEEYYQMIIQQNKGHFGSEISFLQMYSDNQKHFEKLTTILGLYIHILKDYQLYISENISDEKLAYFSLPIIHAIHSQTEEGGRILDILHRRTHNIEVEKYAVSLLKKLGSLEYTRRTLMQLKEDALLEITKLGSNPLLEIIWNKYLNIPLLPDKEQTILQESLKTDPKISSYYNLTENAQSTKRAKEVLLKPFDYLLYMPKRYTILSLFRGFNKTLEVPEERFEFIMNFMYTCGVTLLMLDDIQDRSILRKTRPCSYIIYGMMNTINSIFYTFAKISFELILELNKPEAVLIFYDAIIEMYLGQGLELYWRDNFVCPTEDAYLEMAAEKTGGAFAMIFKLLKLFTPSTANTDRLPALLSQYLQMHDDYENLNNQTYYDNKGFCEDLSEGKFGFPIIHAVSTHPEEGKLIMDIMRQRTYDIELKKTCLSIITKCGSFQYTRKKLKIFLSKLIEEMKLFSDGEEIADEFKRTFYITKEEQD